MRRVWILSLMLSLPAGAEIPDYVEDLVKRTPAYQGLVAARERTHADIGDVNGDGLNEVVVGFKEKGSSPGTGGGIVIFASRDGEYVKVFAGMWDDVYPTGVLVGQMQVTLQLERIVADGKVPLHQHLEYEKDFVFDREKGGLLLGVALEASSTLSAHRARTNVRNVMDGRLERGWAEAHRGTGAGEWVRAVFPAPVDLAAVGIASGNQESEEAWQKANRIRRAELRVGSGFFPREKLVLSLPDTMGIRYYRVGLADVGRLEVRITSVYLGDKYDDAWISELDFVGRLPTPATSSKAPSEKTAPPGETAPAAETSPEQPR